MLADGMTEPEILADYPDLEPEDIREVWATAAAEALRDRWASDSRASSPAMR